jgi:hypothetical protein
MLHDGGCAEPMACLRGVSGDFQNLAERTQRFPGDSSRIIRAAVGYHHNPERLMPTAVAVGGKETGNASGDYPGVIADGYDDADCLDFGCWTDWSDGACGAEVLRHGARIANRK